MVGPPEAGLTGGYWTGLLSGVLISLPATLVSQEWMTMPMLAGFGLLGGLLRDIAPDPEEIWRFSPVFDLLAGYRVMRKGWDLKRSGFQPTRDIIVLFTGASELCSAIRFRNSSVFPSLLVMKIHRARARCDGGTRNVPRGNIRSFPNGCWQSISTISLRRPCNFQY